MITKNLTLPKFRQDLDLIDIISQDRNTPPPDMYIVSNCIHCILISPDLVAGTVVSSVHPSTIT